MQLVSMDTISAAQGWYFLLANNSNYIDYIYVFWTLANYSNAEQNLVWNVRWKNKINLIFLSVFLHVSKANFRY